MRTFCEDRVLKELKRHRDEELLKNYGVWWNNFKLFTHAINKLFSYLNRYFLKNQQAKLIADESMTIFKEVMF